MHLTFLGARDNLTFAFCKTIFLNQETHSMEINNTGMVGRFLAGVRLLVDE